jgi:3-oxoacyl-[acyl-carrier protein] reductase
MLERNQGTILMISSMAGVYGFGGEAVYCATKFAQVGFAQALDRELRPHGIKVGVICPGGVKTEFALGRGRTQEGVSNSGMLEPEDVAGAVLLACKQSPGSRISEIQKRACLFDPGDRGSLFAEEMPRVFQVPAQPDIGF